MPFVRLSIWHVKTMYYVCLSMLEIIPSTQHIVMWRVQIHWQVQEYWNFQNIYVQQTPINFPPYSVNNSRFWCWVSWVAHKQFLSCQFSGLTYSGGCYSYRTVTYWKRPISDCLDSALASQRTGLKQINIQSLTRCDTSNKIYVY